MTEPDALPRFKYATREDWLLAAIKAFRPTFERLINDNPELTTTYGIPDDVRVSVGFGYASRGQCAKNIGGQTWARCTTEDNSPAVFVSPIVADEHLVLAILVHELIHVALDCEDGHRGRFKTMALSLGLEPPLLNVTPSEFLVMELEQLVGFLGPYPHSAIDVDIKVRVDRPVDPDGNPIGEPEFKRLYVGPKPQTSRWIKCMCMTEACALSGRFHGRFSRTVIELAHPICPSCHEPLGVQQ